MTKLFVFDLGNVILPFEHRQIARKLYNQSRIRETCQPEDIFHHIFGKDDGIINDYEKGFVSSERFYGAVRDRYSLAITYEDFKEIWNNIFCDDPETGRIIKYLKEKGYPLVLLSNTSELHFSHIIERYPIVHSFDEWILSFEVGAKKPEQRIYDVVFERIPVSPDQTFYIDDMEEYVEAGRRHGMEGHVFTGAAELWQVLRNKGI